MRSTIKARVLALCVILLPLRVSAQQAEFEKVLVPILAGFGVAGGFGTIWDTLFFATNGGAQPATIGKGHIYGCSIPECADTEWVLEPGATLNLYNAQPVHRVWGRIFRVEAAAADDVWFRLELRERTTGEVVEIPVVRENGFLSGKIVLQQVPIRAGARVALRVFSPERESVAIVRVRELIEVDTGFAPGRTLAEIDLPVLFPVRQTTGQPYFEYLDRLSAYGQILDLRRDLLGDFVGLAMIEVELPGETRGWAFATEADVISQDVVVFSPH